jgi:hypothetical protein
VRIPDSPALDTQQLTVSAWVRGSASPGIWRYIVGKGANGCESASYGLYTGISGGLRFYVTDPNGNNRFSGSVAPAAIWNGKWHHVAGSWDGSTARLFLDGKAIDSAAGTPDTIDYDMPTGDDAGIGAYVGGCDLFYTGDIGQVAVFSQALPVDQIWSRVASLFSRPLR